MNKPIRILVANRPKVMREALLDLLSDQSWIEVIGEVSNDADIPDFVDRTVPDLLVMAVDEPGKRPSLCDVLLRGTRNYASLPSRPTKTTACSIGLRWRSTQTISRLRKRALLMPCEASPRGSPSQRCELKTRAG